MDKTAWFVVTLCVGLLGLNWWYQNDKKDTHLPAATAPAVPTAPQSPESVSSEPTEAQPTQEAALTATVVPREIYTLTAKNERGEEVARYRFQDIGGSLSSVEMVGEAINSTRPDLQEDVRINSFSRQGIGTLMFGLSNDRIPSFDQTAYKVVDSASDASKVTLLGRVGNLIVCKVYSLQPVMDGDKVAEGSAYVLKLSVSIQNTTGQTLTGRDWGLYAGGTAPLSSYESSYHTNYVTMEDGSFTKESATSFSGWFTKDKARIYTRDCNNLEWAGVMNQYYASIIQPDKAARSNAFYTAPVKYELPDGKNDLANGVELAMGIPDFTLAPKTEESAGGQQTFSYTLFTGPKLNLMLGGLNQEIHGLSNIMDYGILHYLSYPMNWLINVFHSWFGNWGLAIVAMTFVVRLLIWPLYRKSYLSMKRMSLLQPKMKELKEKYPDDQQKVSMEMMKLYKEYGISPVGGCLPLFLQMPIFFAFFYVLQTAAEFRGAPFFGWITDLSQMDTVATIPLGGWELPINILPILMVISMMIQMRMNPSAGDPTQQRIMKIMPLFFFLFCYTYASALALYWTTTNIISIFQTWLIRRLPTPELVKQQPRKNGKKGFFERMMEAQKAALEAQQKQQGMRNVTRK